MGGMCTQPACDVAVLIPEKACNAHPDCFFDGQSKSCQTDQCTMKKDTKECNSVEGDNACMWEVGADGVTGTCRHKTVIELGAPSDVAMTCPVTEDDPNLWWLWILLALIVLGLAGVMWRLYLAYVHGYSFTDPGRYNKKFSAQEMYAKDLENELGEDARDKQFGDDKQLGYTQGGSEAPRPELDDL